MPTNVFAGVLHITAEIQAAITDVEAAKTALPADASEVDRDIAIADAIYPHASKLAKELFGKGGDFVAS